jgi:molybdenum cofactor synthesis domain-containing protein
MTKAAIIVIGDEILSGKTPDLNAQFLIGELRELGVSLRRVAIIPDEVEIVAATTRELAAGHDLVFTSGGVGPTHDDVTIQGIARAFDLPVIRHPRLEAVIRDHFRERADQSHLRMADLPEGTVLVDVSGSSWPVPCCRNVFILPGVPEQFRRKFLAIRERFRVEPFHIRVVYVGVDEFEIAASLTIIAATHPAVAIGSYPNFGSDEYRVKLTLESKDRLALSHAFDTLLASLEPSSVVRIESDPPVPATS